MFKKIVVIGIVIVSLSAILCFNLIADDPDPTCWIVCHPTNIAPTWTLEDLDTGQTWYPNTLYIESVEFDGHHFRLTQDGYSDEGIAHIGSTLHLWIPVGIGEEDPPENN